MSRATRRFAPLVFALAIACAGPTLAHQRDPDMPAPDPPDYWRIMDRTDEATTSTCIGNPTTPLCAVENILACFVRTNNELCWIAMRVDEALEMFKTRPVPGAYERYRVASAKRLKDGFKDIPPTAYGVNPRDRPKDVRPGDILLELRIVSCWRYNPKELCETGRRSPRYYIIRGSGDRWVVTGWFTPQWR
ncbi:MAG: hypothetical protein ACT4P2_06320 [Pseudomonadota bacterium]